MKEMSEEKFVELLATVVDSTVKERLKSEREKFWVGPEDHFLDHQVLKKCRERNEENILQRSFINKLMRREKMITSVATKGTAVAAFAMIADYICKKMGVDVGISKFMTIFK